MNKPRSRIALGAVGLAALVGGGVYLAAADAGAPPARPGGRMMLGALTCPGNAGRIVGHAVNPPKLAGDDRGHRTPGEALAAWLATYPNAPKASEFTPAKSEAQAVRFAHPRFQVVVEYIDGDKDHAGWVVGETAVCAISRVGEGTTQ